MAYTITYPWSKEKTLLPKPTLLPTMIPAVCFLAGALALRLLVPESADIFRTLLHPLTDDTTLEAVSSLTADLLAGTPVVEAITAFCNEILQQG